MARVNADGDSLYRRTHSPNLLAWSGGWRPFTSSNKPGKLSKCLYHDHSTTNITVVILLWPPGLADADIIFSSCSFFFLVAALWNRTDHYIFALWFLLSITSNNTEPSVYGGDAP